MKTISVEEEYGMREQWYPGDMTWFEYHCNESDDSPDAPAWHHSHQRARVLWESKNTDAWPGSIFRERAEAGQPKVYHVRFADGLTWDAFEDELLLDPKWFERRDPDALPVRRTY